MRELCQAVHNIYEAQKRMYGTTTMARITISIPDDLLVIVNMRAKDGQKSNSEWICNAIRFKIAPDQTELEVKLHQEILNKESEIAHLQQQLATIYEQNNLLQQFIDIIQDAIHSQRDLTRQIIDVFNDKTLPLVRDIKILEDDMRDSLTADMNTRREFNKKLEEILSQQVEILSKINDKLITHQHPQ